ncbi:MAG TPA: nicotinate-nucleotide adenylyltransferase [Aliidongia sp.]|nr:nicotinate-nucleotide adenylyltransferase [Aliidongia sp.]
MGGSFNPAHRGHRHISLLALRRLALDEVWWLVSPQNPLKPVQGMAPFAERVTAAAEIASHPRIRIADIEARLGTRYTADTLAALRQRFPATRFVWLMGADNLRQIQRWERWTRIFELAPIAVFARPAYSLGALGGLAAHRFGRSRIDPHMARRLAAMPPPAWVFFATRLDPLSATAIRSQRRRSVFNRQAALRRRAVAA